MNDSRNTKNNRARTVGFDRRAKASGNNRGTFARIVVFQVCDFEDATATTAARESSVALGRWERERADAKTPDFAFDRRGVGTVDFVHAPEISFHLVQLRERITCHSQSEEHTSELQSPMYLV